MQDRPRLALEIIEFVLDEQHGLEYPLLDLGLDLLDRGHQGVADAVAQEIVLQVGRVLVEFQAVALQESQDLVFGKDQQRADDLLFLVWKMAESPCRPLPRKSLMKKVSPRSERLWAVATRAPGIRAASAAKKS